MKQRIAQALIMGFITTDIISFILISINMGYTDHFFRRWLKSWSMAYAIIVPVIYFIGPKVQKLVNYLFGNK